MFSCCTYTQSKTHTWYTVIIEPCALREAAVYVNAAVGQERFAHSRVATLSERAHRNDPLVHRKNDCFFHLLDVFVHQGVRDDPGKLANQQVHVKYNVPCDVDPMTRPIVGHCLLILNIVVALCEPQHEMLHAV